MMKPWLYLDDQRTPVDERFAVVRTYDEFVEYISKNGIPEYISFDHDLGEEHIEHFLTNGDLTKIEYDNFKAKTGYHCACWLAGWCLMHGEKLKRVGVHSANPAGAKNIQDRINRFKKIQRQEEDCFIHQPEFIVEHLK